MALSPRLDLRQAQSLVMTPQLQQAIKLLQMSNLELSEYIETELEQNPLLEREDAEGVPEDDAESGDDTASQATTEGFEDGPDQPDSYALTGEDHVDGREDAALDSDFENDWTGDSITDVPTSIDPGSVPMQWQGGDGDGVDAADRERAMAETVTLRDHLISQINMDLADAADRMIAVHLLDQLDEAGYFAGDVAAIAELLNCPPERIEETLDRVQRFDPPGIFARDLADCLRLQLRDRNRLDPAMEALLGNLDLLAKRDFVALRKVCGVDAEDIAEMVEEIKALNPKPALTFDHTVAPPVTPDVLIRPRAGGGWIIELNPDSLPRVLVNNQYYAVISKKARSDAERQYIADCYQTASWLVKSLHQRAQTILKVATEIVELQDGFFTQGVAFLKPLTLRDVAKAVDVHESTVSRVTNNKFIGTPRGIFELRYFFTSGLVAAEGADAHSAEAVRFKIRNLIDAETVENVLSDDRIVEILRDDGIDVARRTVAKYRDTMRIPSSVQRRRQKSLLAQ